MKEFVPFILQGAILSVDEFYCHRERDLYQWERIGHPVDTLIFIICLLWLIVSSPSENHLYVYSALAFVSCLFIAKDEWQHAELCSGFESWLHSLSFMLHPVILIWAGYLWWSDVTVSINTLLWVVGAAVAFMLYQFIYWNKVRA